jgi:hypothetical protein
MEVGLCSISERAGTRTQISHFHVFLDGNTSPQGSDMSCYIGFKPFRNRYISSEGRNCWSVKLSTLPSTDKALWDF